ncbi:MAG: Hsp33 family molecular chaperone HslO [Clostridiales bacterium]|nr:Hsp33 family molecular chaperone HslO [Candidatus Crickella caballi]
MKDYIVRGIAAGGTIRAFAANTTETVACAAARHETYPVVTAALGRLLTAASMMGSMMKGEDDIITLTVKGDGPIGNITATADSKGNVKGFAGNPAVEIPRKGPGKLDVGSAVGAGTMTVVMDLGLSEPYNGLVELQTGEIGDDLAYYFTVSEQTPSAVGLGVMVETDWSVKHAGGFIVQLMPDVEEETIAKLEENMSQISSVTDMMESGMTPEDMLNALLGNLELEITDKEDVRFYCNCDKDRVSAALATIRKEDIQEMIDAGEDIEVKCFFCNTAYKFSVEELENLVEQ